MLLILLFVLLPIAVMSGVLHLVGVLANANVPIGVQRVLFVPALLASLYLGIILSR